MPTLTFDFVAILKVLRSHDVDCIVIGAVSAALQGAPIVTFDLDVVHSRHPDNLDRLLAALQELDACYREHEPRRLRPSLAHLASTGHQLLMTTAGPLDVLGAIEGGLAYDELLPHTIEMEVAKGLSVRLLDLAMLIELKEQSQRDKDRAVLPTLRRTLEERIAKG